MNHQIGIATSIGAAGGAGTAHRANPMAFAVQLTSVSTGVTCNGMSCLITCVATNIAAAATTGFTLINSSITATSRVRVSVVGGGAATSAVLAVPTVIAPDSVQITLTNIGAVGTGTGTGLHILVEVF